MTNQQAVAPIFPFSVADARRLDLTGAAVDVSDHEAFAAYLARERGDAPALVGGYDEHRGVYAGSALFGGVAPGDEPRVIHLGIDIWTDAGTPVAAPLDGTVHSCADNDRFGDYGGTIILDHGYRLSSSFLHLSKVRVEVGQEVATGDIIGEVGATGRATGPHLDWRMSWRRERVDPQLLVPSMPEPLPSP